MYTISNSYCGLKNIVYQDYCGLQIVHIKYDFMISCIIHGLFLIKNNFFNIIVVHSNCMVLCIVLGTILVISTIILIIDSFFDK